MALQKQIVSVPFAGGLNTKVDGIQLPPPQLLIAENCDFSSPGKIQKRAGYRALPAKIPVGNALMSYQDELVACDNGQLYSYDSAVPSFIDKGALVSAHVTKRQIVRNSYQQQAQDSVTDSTGLICTAWEQYSSGSLMGVFYSITDGATGNTIKAPTLISANGIKPKTLTIRNTFAIYYYDTATMRLACLTIPGATASSAHSPMSITSASGDTAINTATPIFDATVSGGTPNIYLTFYTASGHVAVWQFTSPSSLTTGFAKAAVITATPTCLAVFWDGYVGGPVVVYASASAVKYNRFGATTGTTIPAVTTAGSGTVETIAGIVSVTGTSTSSTSLLLNFWYTQYAENATNFLTHRRSLAGVILTSVATSRALSLASKTFVYDSGAYATLAFQSPLQPTYFVKDSSGNTIAKLLYANGGAVRIRSDGLVTLTLVNVSVPASVSINGVQFNATSGSNDIPNRLFHVGVSDDADATALSTVIAGNAMAGITSSNTDGMNSVIVTGLVASVVAGGGTITVSTTRSGTDCLPEASPVPPVSPATTVTQWRVSLLEKDSLTFQSNLPSLTQPDAGLTLIPYSQTGVSALTLDFFNPSNSYLRAELGRNLHIGGGFLWMYDGLKPVEHGFHLYPELSVPAVVTGSGGSTIAGARQFCVCYEWQDNEGQTHRSAPSIPLNVTTDTNGTVTITVPTLRVTAKQGTRTPVTIMPYATIAAPGIIFYQATTTPAPAASGSSNAPIINDPTVDSVTFVFTMSDAQLQLQAQLYTTGGVIENIAPNSVSAIAVSANRIFALDSTNQLSVWYSKECAAGSPVEFSDFFTLNIDPRGGPVTALAGLDSALIAFKESSIFIVQGQGPDSTGAQNSFQNATQVTVTCGCINPRSIVLVPDGLVFASSKGLWLLPRGQSNAQYIGAPVEAFNSATVTSAQLIPTTNVIVFTLQNNPQGAPIALAFDFFVQQWSTWTNLDANDSTIWKNQFMYIRSDGVIMRQTPGEYSDSGQWISRKVQTASINMGQLQGFGRCWRALLIGLWRSLSQEQIQMVFDNGLGPAQFVTLSPPNQGAWGSSPVWGGGVSTNQGPWGGSTEPMEYDLRLNPGRRISSVSLTIYDAQIGNNIGPGNDLSALLFEIGVYGGGRRLSATRMAG